MKTTAMVLTVLGMCVGGSAEAWAGCKKVQGHVEETAVPCASGPGLCTVGPVNGGIQGEYRFTLLSASGTSTHTPSVVHFVGASVIATAKGDLHFSESGALDTAPPGHFVDLQTIIGGTGDFEGASGQLMLSGTFDLASGYGTSRFHGEICTP